MAEHLWGQHAILQPTRDSLSVGDTLMRKAVKQRACKHDRHSYPCNATGAAFAHQQHHGALHHHDRQCSLLAGTLQASLYKELDCMH